MSEVKYISKRLSYCEQNDDTTIIIASEISKSKMTMLTIWLVLFGISGFLISIQMFFPYPGYTRIGFFAFSTFWGYFMYKIGYTWLFKRKGVEFIRITDGKFYLKRAIGTTGKAHEFLLGNIKRIEPREFEKKSFAWELENSFWVLGGERIKFDYLGKEIRLGIQISDDETKKLLQLFHSTLKRFKHQAA